jgi:hypothetical protein
MGTMMSVTSELATAVKVEAKLFGVRALVSCRRH